MSVERDTTMDNADITEDDFDALLNASSLGAPQVLAETEPIPDEVRYRLTRAAAGSPRLPEDGPNRENTRYSADKRAALWLTDTEFARLALSASGDDKEATASGILALPTGVRKAKVSIDQLLASYARGHRVGGDHASPTRADRQDARDAVWKLHSCVRALAFTPASFLRADGQRDSSAQDMVALVRYLLQRGRMDPACSAGPSPVWRSQAPTLDTASMTELLMEESVAHVPASLPRRQTIHAADQTAAVWSALAWPSQEQQDELGTAVREGLGVGIPPADTSVLQLNPDQALRRIKQATRPGGLSARRPAKAAKSKYPRLSLRPAWTPSLLIVSHLPVLQDPFGMPSPLTSDSIARTRTSAESGKDETPEQAGGAARRDPAPAFAVWAEKDEQGLALHTRLQMTFHEEEGDEGEPLTARLTYRLSDPYAVEATFHPDETQPVVWVIARDLMIQGLSHSAGEGDVIVWPAATAGTALEKRAYIRLQSHEGTALLSASHREINQYLEHSQHLCTPGLEHLHVGAALDTLEGELGELTCRGPGE